MAGQAHWSRELAGAGGITHSREEIRALRRAAGRGVELRMCPGCGVPIQKNGGCPSMRCACGRRFQWTHARPLRPCRTCHVDSEEGPFGRWQTCEYCSPFAKAQAATLKAGTASVLAPLAVGAGAAAIAVAATVAIVPAATFGPLALAYEPVRRLRKRRHNPMAIAAASGVASIGFLVMACGYESD